jgi:hypothetical protein
LTCWFSDRSGCFAAPHRRKEILYRNRFSASFRILSDEVQEGSRDWKLVARISFCSMLVFLYFRIHSTIKKEKTVVQESKEVGLEVNAGNVNVRVSGCQTAGTNMKDS